MLSSDDVVLEAIVHPLLLDVGKLHEVVRPVHLVVVLLRVLQHQLVLHVLVMSEPLEVVVPGADGHHEEAEVLVGKEHLHLLVEQGGEVDVALVPVLGSGPPSQDMMRGLQENDNVQLKRICLATNDFFSSHFNFSYNLNVEPTYDEKGYQKNV